MISMSTLKPAVRLTAVMAVFAILPVAAQQVKAAESQAQLTRKQVKVLVSTATTPGDHMTLATYFNREADRLTAESIHHEQLAKQYRNSPSSQAMALKSPMGPRTAAHCEFFAASTRCAALAARELAANHERMAEEAAK